MWDIENTKFMKFAFSGVFLLREMMKRECLSTFSSDRWGRRRCKFFLHRESRAWLGFFQDSLFRLHSSWICGETSEALQKNGMNILQDKEKWLCDCIRGGSIHLQYKLQLPRGWNPYMWGEHSEVDGIPYMGWTSRLSGSYETRSSQSRQRDLTITLRVSWTLPWSWESTHLLNTETLLVGRVERNFVEQGECFRTLASKHREEASQYRLGGPSGSFATFNANRCIWLFFGLCEVEKRVLENSGKHALDHFSWSIRIWAQFLSGEVSQLEAETLFREFQCSKNWCWSRTAWNAQMRPKIRISEGSDAE